MIGIGPRPRGTRRKLVLGKAAKQGLAPGTPLYMGADPGTGTTPDTPATIRVFDYNADRIDEVPDGTLDACVRGMDPATVTWIDVIGVHEPAIINALGETYHFHPLVLEDILNTDQRAKTEDYEDYLYTVIKMLRWDTTAQDLVFEQVSLILVGRCVISFQERPGDVFDAIRNRLRAGKGRIRTMGADYLLYCLLDAIVDGYFVVLDKLDDLLEVVENKTITAPDQDTLGTIYRLRREGSFLRKTIWPVRELVNALRQQESRLITDETRNYLRDLYDHTIQVIDIMEAFREMLVGVLDTYLSSFSNRMNEVMKVLTIIATIFIPITFIAGVYGMNFEAMPELRWPWGYAFAWGLMLAVAGTMLLYFRRKRWL